VPAEQVEQGGVDGRDREWREAQHSREGGQQRDALRCITPDERRCDARLDELDDRGLCLGRERCDGARLAVSDHAVVRRDPDDHVRRGRSIGRPEPEDLLERCGERDRLDAGDVQRGCSWW
jgi:hypothetical protein